MTNLKGNASSIYNEVVMEIKEEIEDSFATLVNKEKIKSMTETVIGRTGEEIQIVLKDRYQDNLTDDEQFALGDQLARIVNKAVKVEIKQLTSELLQASFELVEELRDEIIDEVYETIEETKKEAMSDIKETRP